MLANVDGLTGTPDCIEGVYEGKTSRHDWRSGGQVEVPLEYGVQGQHYLAVLGLERVHYACLVGGQQLVVTEVERNQTLIDDLIAIEEDFWRHVLDGTPPAVAAEDRSLLSKRWAPTERSEKDLIGTHVTNLKVRQGHVANIKRLQAEVDRIDAELMEFMGEATEGIWQGETLLTWRSATSTRLDTTAFKEAHPALAAEFAKTTTSRRFLPKEIEG
jgi:predicted phage-related endonuclease